MCPTMRLLTHNTLRNNTKAAKAGFPLTITATEIRVDTNEDDIDTDFIQNILPILDWPALLQAATQMGLPPNSLPPNLTDEMVQDQAFLQALYHVLMNVHLVRGILTCPDTGREFAVTDGIVDFMLKESECV
uniref:Multifunctional methyltransferase subunit TRM112-like protein n=1 Tax=Leptocylindrus danicus TaxID=163516 RepID=A0A7S2NVK9_9STRA|mmetsp:Transcript_14773/g.21823  ORF Transcript_14773/g.21823 Transcript_14773/m.21823 type:complete len:132 (+) Transcript_14773:18-413(+)